MVDAYHVDVARDDSYARDSVAYLFSHAGAMGESEMSERMKMIVFWGVISIWLVGLIVWVFLSGL